MSVEAAAMQTWPSRVVLVSLGSTCYLTVDRLDLIRSGDSVSAHEWYHEWYHKWMTTAVVPVRYQIYIISPRCGTKRCRRMYKNMLTLHFFYQVPPACFAESSCTALSAGIQLEPNSDDPEHLQRWLDTLLPHNPEMVSCVAV